MNHLSDAINQNATNVSQIAYIISVLLFIFSLKKMSSPKNAQMGLSLAGLALLIAVISTFFHYDVNSNYLWMFTALIIGGGLGYLFSRNTKIIEIPKMVALFNGFAGGAVAAIASLELLQLTAMPDTTKGFVLAAAMFGCISLSSSLTAFSKQHGVLKNSINLPMHQWLNALILVITVTFGIAIILNGKQFDVTYLLIFLALSLVLGKLITFPMNKTDMPVLISLMVALSGLAVGLIGYVLINPVMMIAGLLVAATAIKLTRLVTRAMNRPFSTVLFNNTVTADDFDYSLDNPNNVKSTVREIQSNDAATIMAFAKSIIIVPGYGMAVAQAQHRLWEMSKLLKGNGVKVKFAVHPVAGRMPGHMNVLLSEAGIPYDSIYDIDEINGEFESTDVVLLVGANDTTNISARTDQNSSIFGMPILNVDQAKNVIVIKRAEGTGFSDIDNPLFYKNNTAMLYGDAQPVLSKLVSELKNI